MISFAENQMHTENAWAGIINQNALYLVLIHWQQSTTVRQWTSLDL